MEKNDIRLLPTSIEQFAKVADLPFHHRDPFDRLLVAQALVENLPVVSSDGILDQYGITRIW
jgi:PIN domain nuclease of toxin-antitoxin system